MTSSEETNNQLARLLLENPDLRHAITLASDQIDKHLATDPRKFADEYRPDGTAIAFEPPLWVQFAIFPPDRRVQILTFALTRPSSRSGFDDRADNN